MDVLKGSAGRGGREARRIKAAGYKGEKVVILSASNIPTAKAASIVAADLFKQIGLNADYQEMEWASVATRRMRKEPADQGGWNVWINPRAGAQPIQPGREHAAAHGAAGLFRLAQE